MEGLDDGELVQDALEHAIEALERAACALTVATMLAPRRGALAHDAYVPAEAMEGEIAAVRCTLLRRCRGTAAPRRRGRRRTAGG